MNDTWKSNFDIILLSISLIRLKGFWLFNCIEIVSVIIGNYIDNLSGIRQKVEFQSGCFKKAKHAKISEKQTFLTPLIRTRTCANQEVGNVCLSKILACFTFLKHPFWDSPFCLITDELTCPVFYEQLVWRDPVNQRWLLQDWIEFWQS